MITRLLNWLRNEPVRPPSPVLPSGVHSNKYADYSVEHYPITGRFYPKRDGRYIKRNYQTGIYELLNACHFMYADHAQTEDDAWKIIDLVIEQHDKVNVQTFTR
jgi:hypothetical protein